MFLPIAILALVQGGSSDTLPTPVRIGGIEIRASIDSVARRAVQPVALLDGAALRTQQAPSLGETLAGLAGLRSMSMTTGIGKPVIRGLHSTRIVTLDGGQRVETQQWGADHAPNVETMGAERIEVVKGPSSVRYGSDAIGGVINVVRRPLLDARGLDGWLAERSVAAAYNSGISGSDATAGLDLARGRGAVRGTLTARNAGAMRTPGGALPNTQSRAVNGEMAAMWRAERVSAEFTAASREERIGIFDDTVTAPDFRGYQRISTDRARLVLRAPLREGSLEATTGWERNFRREYDPEVAPTVALGLLATTLTSQVEWHHPLGDRWRGTAGVFAMHGRFEKRGSETLIPSSTTADLGAYVTESADYGRLAVSVGARYDRRALDAERDEALGLAAQTRRFDAVTGSVGASYALWPAVVLAVNVGRGFRAPTSSELFANGFHEGTRAFERGDPTLKVETSLSTDVSLRVARGPLRAELSTYHNRIADYIYLRPFGSGGLLFDSLAVVQGDAVLRGVEFTGRWRVAPALELSSSADYGTGTNTATALPLNFMPPLRVMATADLTLPTVGSLLRPHLALVTEHNARQTRLEPRDIATAPFTLLHLRGGTALAVGGRVLLLDLDLRNALDQRYRDHLSRYKEFADAVGRAVILRVTTRW
jgi:iron complex outermembrane recepter protein